MQEVIVRLHSNNEFIKLQSQKSHDLDLATTVLLQCGMITGLYCDEKAIHGMGFVPNVIGVRDIAFEDTVEQWQEENEYYERKIFNDDE